MTKLREFEIGASLECLIEGISSDMAKPNWEAPHLIRRRIEHLIQGPAFLNDCLELLLSQLVARSGSNLLFLDPSRRYSLQMFCWPPGFSNEPHLHTAWTVSAVMQNSLVVFRSKTSAEDCLKSPPLSVTVGQVGVLIPPQFHCFCNEGSEAAVTFHVFSRDPISPAATPQALPEHEAQIFDDDDIFTLVKMTVASKDKRSIDIIEMAFALVEAPTKLRIVKLMATIDPDRAVRFGNALCEVVGEHDANRLRRALAAFHNGGIDRPQTALSQTSRS